MRKLLLTLFSCGLALLPATSPANHFGLFFGNGFRAVIDCTSSLAFATAASKTWNSSTRTYGACVASSCNSGFNLVSGQCVPDLNGAPQQQFITSGTWTAPFTGAIALVGCGGGGGGGGGAYVPYGGAGGGGGAGGNIFDTVINVTQGVTYTITIGNGGAGGSGNGNGGAGQDTIFLQNDTPLVTWQGGAGGGGGPNQFDGPIGGYGATGFQYGGSGGYGGAHSGGTGQSGQSGAPSSHPLGKSGGSGGISVGSWGNGGSGGGGGGSFGFGGGGDTNYGLAGAVPGYGGGGGGRFGVSSGGNPAPAGGQGILQIFY